MNFSMLFILGQYPLFVLCVISKKRDRILIPLIFSNLLVSFVSMLHYKINNAIHSYLILAMAGIILSLVYLIFYLIYKKKASEIFDNDNYIDKEKYIQTYLSYEKKWIRISKLCAILAIVYLPLVIYINGYLNKEELFNCVIQEIIIISNYFIWSRCAKQLVNEREGLI